MTRPVILTAFGDAQISTAQSKFGGASLSIPSTGNYLNVVDNSNFNFTNDYTIEFWAYISSKTSGAKELFQINDSGTLRANIQFSSANNYGFLCYMPSFRVFDGRAGELTYADTSAGQWYHIAFTKQGTTYRFFIDGVLRESATGTPTETHTQVTIGSLSTSSYINPDAYLDEFRISNTARYTANFAPATQPHVNDSNTLLLLHMDGANGSTNFVDDFAAPPIEATAALNSQSNLSCVAVAVQGLIAVIPNPNFDNNDMGLGDATVADQFGAALAFNDDYIVVGATEEKHPDNAVYTVGRGRVYVFSKTTRSLLYSLLPTSQPGFNPTRPATSNTSGYFQLFGQQVYVGNSGASKNKLVVTDRFAVFVFDLDTGQQLRENPTVGLASSAISNSFYAVTDASGIPQVTIRHIANGAVLHTLVDPQNSESLPNAFGSTSGLNDNLGSVSLTDQFCLIGDRRETVQSSTLKGKAYLFNMSNGQLQHTFEPPEIADTRFFGTITALTDTHAFVTATPLQGGTANRTYAFKLTDNSLDKTFDDSRLHSANGLKVLIHDTVYSIDDGSVIRTLPDLDPYPFFQSGKFAISGFLQGSQAILGDTNELLLTPDYESNGYAYVYSLPAVTANAEAILTTTVTLAAVPIVPIIANSELLSNFDLQIQANIFVIQPIQANLQSNFSSVCVAQVIASGIVNLDSQLQLTATPQFITVASAGLDSNFQITTASTVLSQAGAALFANTQLSVESSRPDPNYFETGYIDADYFETVVVLVDVEAALASAFAIVVSSDKIKQTSSVLNSEFAVSTVGQKIMSASAVLNSAFAQTAFAGKLIDVELAFDALFTTSLTAQAKINSFAVLDTVADLTATASKFTGYESLLEFFAALNAQAARTRDSGSAISAQFDTVTTAARLRDSESSLAVSFEQTTVAQVIKGIGADLLSQTALSVLSTVLLDFESAMNSEFVQTAQARVLAPDQAQLDAAFALTATVGVITSNTVAAEISSDLTAQALGIRDFSVELAAFNSILIVGAVTHDSTVTLDSVFSLTAQGTNLITVDVELNSVSTLTAQGKLFGVIEKFVYTVPRENRVFVIASENRQITIRG